MLVLAACRLAASSDGGHVLKTFSSWRFLQQVFVQSRAVILVLGGSSNQLPGDGITLAQERVQKRGG